MFRPRPPSLTPWTKVHLPYKAIRPHLPSRPPTAHLPSCSLVPMLRAAKRLDRPLSMTFPLSLSMSKKR
ncbi:hypothetical protein C8Q74DRAFT_1302497 [Fomes fomentarius]|nr:hypothetical protein C8Q74DRAFT_1302497 [Fomes fomentarius]